MFPQDGTPIESGRAVETGVRSGEWTYTATAHVALGSDIFIEVNGVDHAGHETKLTENLADRNYPGETGYN